jgi:hypothetical protein
MSTTDGSNAGLRARLEEARQLRDVYAQVSSRRRAYDGSQAGDPLFFAEQHAVGLDLVRLRTQARNLVARHLEATLILPGVTAEALRRHVARFGPDGVAAVADAAGVDLRAKPERPDASRQRRTTDELVRQVLALAAKGMLATAIADRLNVSDRRVAAILAAAVEDDPTDLPDVA